MPSIIRNWIIFALLIFSIGVVLLHRFGAFDLEFDLLKSGNNKSIYKSQFDNITSSYTFEDGHHKLSCKVRYIVEVNYCSLTILLSNTGYFPDLAIGQDLSHFSTVDMDIDYSAPVGSPNIRVSFRNFNSAYSKYDDYTSLKYNTYAFEPSFNNNTSALPLTSFSVEEWWIDRFNIPSMHRDIELTNVSYIEFFPNEIAQISDYEITVKRFILRGVLISEATLLTSILVLWLILIVGLTIQNTRHLKFVATTDGLTGCINRRGITQWAIKHLNSFYTKESFSIFYLDVDDFKKINDNYGHNIGDELLIKFAQHLNDVVNKNVPLEVQYKVSRLAGDEFAIVLFDLNTDNIVPLAKVITRDINRPISLTSRSIKISTSIGISHTNVEPESFQDMIEKADMAMYFAKKQGKNQYKIFDKSIAQNIYFRKKTSDKIKAAIDNNNFHLNYMPIYNCDSLTIDRVEVLIRCTAEALKDIGPDIYIPIAEEFNLIQEIDMWVIENTLKIMSENKTNIKLKPVIFCINISAVELHNSRFVSNLQALLQMYRIAPQKIELEITETSLVDANEKSINTLKELKNLGVKLALDDFGTGYTAFNQLIHYPVNCLKIDKSFIDDLCMDNKTQIIMLNAILSIAKAYKLETVAEGIETKEQLNFMQQNGCNYVQGYFLAKPADFETLLDLLYK